MKKEKVLKSTKRPKQLSFIKPQKKFFGGALLYKKRKSMRPLSSKDSIHFVLRSQWAMGRDSFLANRNKQHIERIIKRFAIKFGVTVYQQAINSNHVHLLLRITNRILYRAFIKAVSGKIASHVMGQQSFKLFAASRGNLSAGDGSNKATSQSKSERFWQFRPFSRVVNWGEDFQTCLKYLRQNALEALGFIPYTERKNYYTKWLKETIHAANERIKSFPSGIANQNTDSRKVKS